MTENKFKVKQLDLVEEFIASLEKTTIAKVAKAIDLLGLFGARLNMPYSKKIDKDIYELRIRGKQEVRIFYAFIIGNIFLLHGFVKKSDKLPLKEIKLARARFRDLTG